QLAAESSADTDTATNAAMSTCNKTRRHERPRGRPITRQKEPTANPPPTTHRLSTAAKLFQNPQLTSTTLKIIRMIAMARVRSWLGGQESGLLALNENMPSKNALAMAISTRYLNESSTIMLWKIISLRTIVAASAMTNAKRLMLT